jgi:hypothetical protein
MDPNALLLWSMFAALCAVGLTIILRNAPFVRGWVAEAKKPWACNVCMSLYSSALASALSAHLAGDWRIAFVYLPTYALTFLVLDRMTRPPPGPPNIPMALLSDDGEGD